MAMLIYTTDCMQSIISRHASGNITQPSGMKLAHKGTTKWDK